MALQQQAVTCLSTGGASSADDTSAKVEVLSPLLRLLPEIRDMIFETVLTTTLSAPRKPTDKIHRKLLSTFRNEDMLEQTTYYPLKPIPDPARNLLLTCHQIRREILALISRFGKKKSQDARYELSITILAEQTLYPTWLLVPISPLESARLVWTDIHITGPFKGQVQRNRSGWQGSDGWIPPLVWGLFNILNRFLLHGPAFASVDIVSERTKMMINEYEDLHPANTGMVPVNDRGHSRSRSLPIRELKLLVLNVVTPTEAEMEGKSFWPINRLRRSKDTIEAVTRPEEVLLELEGQISHIVRRTIHAAEYSQLLYERLKAIRLCLDGKERFSWNLSERKRQTPEEKVSEARDRQSRKEKDAEDRAQT
jgi:hypothetical protein